MCAYASKSLFAVIMKHIVCCFQNGSYRRSSLKTDYRWVDRHAIRLYYRGKMVLLKSITMFV